MQEIEQSLSIYLFESRLVIIIPYKMSVLCDIKFKVRKSLSSKVLSIQNKVDVSCTSKRKVRKHGYMPYLLARTR